MSTIDSKHLIDELIENDGYYMDDPRVVLIVEYINSYGRKCWGITYENEDDPTRYLMETPYVSHPKIIWAAS